MKILVDKNGYNKRITESKFKFNLFIVSVSRVNINNSNKNAFKLIIHT